jgi:hypothetical protein
VNPGRASTAQRDDDSSPAVDTDELSGPAGDAPPGPPSVQPGRIRGAVPVAVLLCIACAGLADWLGFRAWQAHQLSTARTVGPGSSPGRAELDRD